MDSLEESPHSPLKRIYYHLQLNISRLRFDHKLRAEEEEENRKTCIQNTPNKTSQETRKVNETKKIFILMNFKRKIFFDKQHEGKEKLLNRAMYSTPV